jgi:hypothetical protein
MNEKKDLNAKIVNFIIIPGIVNQVFKILRLGVLSRITRGSDRLRWDNIYSMCSCCYRDYLSSPVQLQPLSLYVLPYFLLLTRNPPRYQL